MMKYVFFVIACFWFVSIRAQTDAQKKIPPFKILLPAGNYFTASDIPKNKPVMLIYFSPDCDHCRTLLQSFFKKVDEFNKAEIVLITYKPLEEVTRFVYDYSLGKYPNITVGTEGNTFFIRYFYKLTATPFVALFSKEGALIQSYRKILIIDQVLSDFKKIKK